MKSCLPSSLGGIGGRYSTPVDFQEFLRKAKVSDDLVVIDARNHYETAVGKFQGAVDPKLRSFAQFPNWLAVNKESLAGKQVALYCTGGIRCEKATSFVRTMGIAKEVYQLHGGISMYLEEFGEKKYSKSAECLFDGVNFLLFRRILRATATGRFGAMFS